MKTRLAKLLDRLEKFHGKPKRPRPEDPYEMVLHRNCGYPQSDDRCDKGFLALKQKVGLRPAEILATPETKLAEVMRAGGMVPELRARRLKEIAARVESEFGGDLQAVLRRPLSEAKKAFKKFPTIGDPGAEKILLFTKTAPVAAVPANCVHVLPRLGFGEERKNYAATYRSAQEALRSELPEDCAAQLRAYLLIKRHGLELCKASRPKCEQCPVSSDCNYFQRQRSGE
jgi:endonuclease-3